MPDGADMGADFRAEHAAAGGDWLRRSWRAAVCVSIFTGMLHLLNLVPATRIDSGPLLLTPFRLSFFIAWVMLILVVIRERSIPRPNWLDIMVAVFALAYIIRGLFLPETFGIALNWIVTAAGIYFLVRLGVRDRNDVRAFLFTIIAAAVVIDIYGLVEYFSKSNFLFDAIEVEAIGSDSRIAASGQYYRVRSFVGHPGFTAAVLLASIPLTVMALWRRHAALLLVLGLTLIVIFFTFSRGSWLLAVLVIIPLLVVMFRASLRRYVPWVAAAVLVALAVVSFSYIVRDEVFVEFGEEVRASGIEWSEGTGLPVRNTPEGIMAVEMFVYADVADDYGGASIDAATVVVHYLDDGLGVLRVDYLSAPVDGGESRDWATPQKIHKTDTGNWTNAAFYIERPQFTDHPYVADLRVVDEDNSATIRRLEVHAGRLDMISQVIHQWESRTASFSTRFSTYPRTWDVLRENPLGVGLYNSPGTGNRAVDSLPLTWIMEMGWIGLMLVLGLIVLIVSGLVRALRDPMNPATVFYLALLLLLAHGGHLMILYDKPSIVMLGAVAALYAASWRRADEGGGLPLSFRDVRV